MDWLTKCFAQVFASCNTKLIILISANKADHVSLLFNKEIIAAAEKHSSSITSENKSHHLGEHVTQIISSRKK